MFRKMIAIGLMATIMAAGLTTNTVEAKQRRVLNIYSSRHYGATEQMFVSFTAATGIEVRVSQGSPQALLERLRAEGDRTPADLFIAVDAGVLDLAAEEGLLQSVESEALTTSIPEAYRDPDGYWFALGLRARTIIYNTENIDPAELSDYAGLADPQWKDRLCLRPGSHIYTISLVSSLVYHLGEEGAKEVVDGWVANNPTYIDSDEGIMAAVAAGQCDVGIINHYYFARQNEDIPVELFWANQETTGVFFNATAAGVTANAENADEAIEFLEWMSGLEGQANTPDGLPGGTFEFPVNAEAELSERLLEFGEIKFDTEYPLWEYGNNQAAAITLLEEAGYGMSED